MSIKEDMDKSKPTTAIPGEEEFEIVPSDGSHGNPVSWRHHALWGAVVVLIASISFGIGRLITYENAKPSITVSTSPSISSQEAAVASAVPSPNTFSNTSVPAPAKAVETMETALSSGPIVASKNGTKYYLTTCSGAKRISDANKIYFASTEDARKAGLTPSSTCKGLK